MPTTLRHRLYRQLDPRAWAGHGLSPLNRWVAGLILASVLLAVIDSEPAVMAGREVFFHTLEYALGAVFLVEYLARVWVCVEHPREHGAWRARWRFIRSPAGVCDLLALSPLLLHGMGAEAYMLRLLRVLRLVRLARLGRFSPALNLLAQAVKARRFELLASAVVSFAILLISSTLLYMVEGPGQPETFGSIPRAMWWAVSTMTTVGYGDAVPHTGLGKLLSGLTAIVSIGFIAMPTGILAAAFSDALHKRRHEDTPT